MRQKLFSRLDKLERISAAARPASDSTDSTALAEFRAKLEALRADPKNQEWLAAQPPDYLRNNVRALRAELMERASGHRRGMAA
jgi:hypothetical protein